MLFRSYRYFETDEDGEILDNEVHYITLKADADVSKLEKELGTHLIPDGEVFEYDTEKTEFRKFAKGEGDKFAPLLPTFHTVND